MKFTPPIPSCSNENYYFHVGDYSFGFNGKELDKEGMGGGASTYDYGFRIYNAALGRFLSADPLTKSYPWNSTYAYAENRIIDGIDLDGCEFVTINRHTVDGVTVQLNINKAQSNITGPMAPPITETETTHNTNPAGQVVRSASVPTTISGASLDSQMVMNDVNGAGTATTQGRLATVPSPAPLAVVQAQDQSHLSGVLGNRNVNVENVRIPVYGQFNSFFAWELPGGAPAFERGLSAEITLGNLSPTGLSTTLPGNVSRVMIFTDGTPANVLNAQTQIANFRGNNPQYDNISIAIVSDPTLMTNLVAANPRLSMNSVLIILNPTSDFTFYGTNLGSIPATSYVMPFTSLGSTDTNGMIVEPQIGTQGLLNLDGTPTQ